MSNQPLPVGVRFACAGDAITPAHLTEVCRVGLELGYESFWVGDHVILPEHHESPYPYSDDGKATFSPQAPWTDPLVQFGWLAGQFPSARFGTSVLILTLRNPVLLAKQIATLSWLTSQPFSLGVGTGWLREEYDAVGAVFEHRATRAKEYVALIRDLITTGQREFDVRNSSDEQVSIPFAMRPAAQAPVHFLWGGHSPLALRIIASSCDGWLPTKHELPRLEANLAALKQACADVERDFSELRLVVKPGPGPDPESGAIDRDTLTRYGELGFHEVILEMPLELNSAPETISIMERVAARTW